MTEQQNKRMPARRYRRPVGPRLKQLLWVLFGLFAILMVNSVYLVGVTFAEWQSGQTIQDWFYQIMFLVHLILGLAIILPVIIFGIIHIRNTYNRPNRRAVQAGYALFVISLVLLASGIILTRIDGIIVITDPITRTVSYWIHILSPLACIWLYVLHRLAGRRIKWKVGAIWGGAAIAFALLMIFLHAQDPRQWNVTGPESGEQYFFPALSRTSSGNFIPARVLDNDEYCLECHEDIHDQWMHSAHRFSSFNNPVYEFSVRGTRQAMMVRDGNVQGARFCAGCHDPVPFFSGAFDDPKWDDPDYDIASDEMANAGVTCTVCHVISNVNSVRGNGDFTIDEPTHYPFTFSENAALRWINRQLVKAKPEFHKATFLKPLHSSAEFCGTCHKVHLPVELNEYKWLRGQNHYDTFLLSGVSGSGISSFYYPEKAEEDCNACHLPLVEVAADTAARNFSAIDRDDSGILKTMDHRFLSANTAMAALIPDQMRDPEGLIQAHSDFNEGVMRVDIFGLRDGGEVNSPLVAPLGPQVPALVPGNTYLIETNIRTLKMGHMFTQGTTDSNEIWLDFTVKHNGTIIGRSGGRNAEANAVDPWSHFVNSFIIDRHGNRINRRNAQDIFTSLYSNQIPPGAADVVHYRFEVPTDISGEITMEVKLQYRKFDTELMRFVYDDPKTPELDPYFNNLPIMTMAEDSMTFHINDTAEEPEEDFPLWQRWNDYGIALLRNGQLRQAEQAFAVVEELGRPDGPLNLARVYLQEGRITDEAPAALRRARDFGRLNNTDLEANEWSVLWFAALVQKRNGQLDDAIENFRQILEGGFRQAQGRGFDFTRDYRLLNEYADTLFQRGLQERGDKRREERLAFMNRARDQYLAALLLDPENATAHYGLHRVYEDIGDEEQSASHAAQHAKYKTDDNALDIAITAARRQYPAANHAAEDVVIYDLQRSEAYELNTDTDASQEVARND